MNTRTHIATIATSALLVISGGCSTDDNGEPAVSTTDTMTPTSHTVDVNGTTLHVERHGTGSPLLLIHGGSEDSSMLAAQAASLAAAGYEVATHDRRGTGRSGSDNWPGDGAAQHADDAAELIDHLGWTDTTVVGVSSGGVIALDLASRHPTAIGHVFAWEPPAVGIVPNGGQITAEVMAPVEAHLAEQPGDFVGAQALLLSAILGFPVTVDDPAFADARANAETFVRDEPAITASPLDLAALADSDVTLAVGSAPNELIATAVDILEHQIGRPAVRVDADHEVYLTNPTMLTAIVTGRPDSTSAPTSRTDATIEEAT